MDSTYVANIRAANTALFVEGDLDAASQYFTEDYRTHLTEGEQQGGRRGVRKYVDLVRRAFPSLRVEVEVLVESGDRVAWQRISRGIQEGAFVGFPASGKEIVWRDMVVSRVEGGLIAEEWLVTDLAERLLASRKR